MTFRISN